MKKSYLLSAIAVLLVIGVGFTFAYFVSGVNVGGEGSSVTLEPGDMIEVIYDAGSSTLTSTNLMPGDTASKNFTVTVRPTDTENTATYAIYLDITNNTFTRCTDANYDSMSNACTLNAEELTYTIRGENNEVLATGDLTGKTGKVRLLQETKTVNTETTFTYTLEITFEETNADQNHNANATINGDVVVEFSELLLPATDVIEGLYPDNQNMLAYDDYDNLRYIGADPNNYVSFNGELWRIIGVFSEDTHGLSGQKLVKLIRSESLGDLAWNSADTNDWSTASLQTILNGDYLNGSGTYASSGIKNDETRNMIETVTWKLGGSSTYNDVTASMFYERERGTTVYSGRPTEWIGKVALMYPSDYGYATSGGATTTREACLAIQLYIWDTSSFSDCKNNDWLYNSGALQWTLTPSSSASGHVFSVTNLGNLYYSNANYGYGARPSVYLKSTIAISGGTGSSTDPYILEM